MAKFYKVGQKFRCSMLGGTVYILAYIGKGGVCLINLESGNRWRAPVPIKNILKITEKEFSKIIVRHRDNFTLIK